MVITILSNADINYMVEKSRKISKITKLRMRYKIVEEQAEGEEQEDDYGYGYDDGKKAKWSDWDEYWCSPDTIDDYNIDEYSFGEVQVGDLVLVIPNDTTLPERADEYEIEFDNDKYRSKTTLKKKQYVGNQFLYYTLVAETV